MKQRQSHDRAGGLYRPLQSLQTGATKITILLRESGTEGSGQKECTIDARREGCDEAGELQPEERGGNKPKTLRGMLDDGRTKSLRRRKRERGNLGMF